MHRVRNCAHVPVLCVDHVRSLLPQVIIDPSGAVITTKGREKVVGNPGGFPWH